MKMSKLDECYLLLALRCLMVECALLVSSSALSVVFRHDVDA